MVTNTATITAHLKKLSRADKNTGCPWQGQGPFSQQSIQQCAVRHRAPDRKSKAILAENEENVSLQPDPNDAASSRHLLKGVLLPCEKHIDLPESHKYLAGCSFDEGFAASRLMQPNNMLTFSQKFARDVLMTNTTECWHWQPHKHALADLGQECPHKSDCSTAVAS